MPGAYYSKRYGYNDNWFGPTPKSHRRTSAFGVFLRTAASVAREAERNRRAKERHRLHLAKEQLHFQQVIAREQERNEKAREREAKKQYIEARNAEVARLNNEISESLSEISNVLPHTLSVDDTLSFEELRKLPPFIEFDESEFSKQEPQRPFVSTFTLKIKRPPSWLMLFGFVRRAYEKNISGAQIEFKNALEGYEAALVKHRAMLAALKKQHAEAKEKYLQMAAELTSKIEEFEKQYRSGSADSVQDYCSMVLERSEYPEAIQPDFILDYEASSKSITVKMLMPGADVIPAVASYTYVKSRDAIDKKMRSPKEVDGLYRRLLAAIALRSIHEIIEADQGGFLDTVTFSGYTDYKKGTPDSVTASEVIALSVSKSQFLKIDLATVLPIEIVEKLGGKLLKV